MNRIEFEYGSKVTYKGAGDPIPCMVKKVQQNPMNDTIEYHLLSLPNAKVRVKTICTGRSIMESQYYSPKDAML